jgi:hypothetical protein
LKIQIILNIIIKFYSIKKFENILCKIKNVLELLPPLPPGAGQTMSSRPAAAHNCKQLQKSSFQFS